LDCKAKFKLKQILSQEKPNHTKRESNGEWLESVVDTALSYRGIGWGLFGWLRSMSVGVHRWELRCAKSRYELAQQSTVKGPKVRTNEGLCHEPNEGVPNKTAEYGQMHWNAKDQLMRVSETQMGSAPHKTAEHGQMLWKAKDRGACLNLPRRKTGHCQASKASKTMARV
jgi:hypothetical protein